MGISAPPLGEATSPHPRPHPSSLIPHPSSLVPNPYSLLPPLTSPQPRSFTAFQPPPCDTAGMRFDLSSLGVLSLAVASSLTVLWWMDMGGVRGAAHAAGTAGVARVARAADGHYWADALVDGRPVRLMVDTGASRVILTRADAARLGVEPAADAFSTTLATAAGPVGAAPVRLRSVAVAGVALDGVDALVVDRGLPHSLLGMSYLGRLSAFTATPTRLTLEG